MCGLDTDDIVNMWGLCYSRRPPLERRLKEIEVEAERLALSVGPCRTFNLAKPPDCHDLLYEHLKLLPPPSATRGKSGDLSTKVRHLTDNWSQADCKIQVRQV